MGQIDGQPYKGMLFFALLGRDEAVLHDVRRRLALDFSAVEIESAIVPSTHADCGNSDGALRFLRLWISTSLPIDIPELVEIKRFTSRLEETYAAGGTSLVHIDPGYVTGSKAVRATSRDSDHRILLGRGVFAEPVVRFAEESPVEVWPWAPADYHSAEAAGFLLQVRQHFSSRLIGGLASEV